MKKMFEFKIPNQPNIERHREICDGAHLSWYRHNNHTQSTIQIWVLTDALYGFYEYFEFHVQNCHSVRFIKSHDHLGHDVLIEHNFGIYREKNYFRNRISIFDFKGKCLRNFEIPQQVQKYSFVRPSPTGDIYFFIRSVAHVVSQDGTYMRLFQADRTNVLGSAHAKINVQISRFRKPKFDFDDSSITSLLSWSADDDLYYFDYFGNDYNEVIKFDRFGNFVKKVTFPFHIRRVCPVPNFSGKLLLIRTTPSSRTDDIILGDFENPEIPGIVIQSDAKDADTDMSIGPNGKLTTMSRIFGDVFRIVRFYE